MANRGHFSIKGRLNDESPLVVGWGVQLWERFRFQTTFCLLAAVT
ncbi:hypothetical protein NEISICOT_00198 [Neisseria sicca ATCC 29256]|uniref:Uncharacterized protein n=1 Tax=Neisseria sicca ATCC 29256 TaxID=547045 RepID=C6M119_NEISI|nr:hypothetical protein NEISICOT_00198 [Neisseria sicca ATCC 29256]